MLNGLKLQLIKLKYNYKIILGMMGLTLLMVFLFSGSGNSDYKEKIAIVDFNESEIATDFIDKLSSNENYIIEKTENDIAIDQLKKSKITTIIYLPENFDKSIIDGKKIDIEIKQIKTDVSTNILKNQIKESIIAIRTDKNIIKNLTIDLNESYTEDEIKSTYNKYFEYKKPFNLVISKLDMTANTNNLNYSIIGFCIFFVSYSIVYTIADILEDVEKKTWQRALVTPIGINNLIFSNSIIAFIIGFVQMNIVFIITDYIFKSNFSEKFLEISLISSLYVFSLVGISTFILSFVKTFKQLDSAIPLVLTSMAMLGGCLWPLEIVNSKIILFLANLTPHKWAIIAYNKILIGDLSIYNIKLEMGYLFIVGFILYLIGIYKLNKRVFE